MISLADLAAIREKMQDRLNSRPGDHSSTRIVVGMATCGIAAGARPVLTAFNDEVNSRKLQNVVVLQTGCIGICLFEPVVEVYKPGQDKVTYVHMTPEKVAKIVAEHIVDDNVVSEYTIGAAE
ncbi:MAG: (2Fe-2S) ferredoxin domain-containing protein [Clostridiales bacterium]|nr:(2Fe-2S) ferredoxin domain-containing protein [Clostridiales bacterium]